MNPKRIRHIVSLVFLAAIILSLFTWQIINTTDQRMREELLQQAQLVVQIIRIRDVKELSFTPADRQTAPFQRLSGQMKAAMQVIDCRMIYSMVQRGDDIVFGPETVPEGDPYASPPGTPYYQAPEVLQEVFRTRNPAAVGPYRDEYGVFVSVFAPVTDPATDEMVMVLGMDVEASAWIWKTIASVLLPVSLVALSLLLTLLAVRLVRSNREIRRREAELRESENRYGSFVANASEGIFRIDLLPPVDIEQSYERLVEQFAERAVVGEVNAALAKMYGITPEQMVGRPVRDFAPNCGEQIADLVNTEDLRLAEREEEEIAADGSPIYIVESYHGEMQDGKLARVWGVHRDITERKRAEQTLRESEAKYRLIADNMADTISVMDLNMRFTYVSPSIVRLRGFTADEAMSQSVEQIMTPDSLETAIRAFQEEMAREAKGTADPDRNRVLEVEEYKKDGSTIWLSNNMSFLRDENGKPTAVLIVSSDITERKNAENRLKEANVTLRNIIEFLPDATLIVDRNEKIIAWNRAMEEMSGVSKEEMIGQEHHQGTMYFYGEVRSDLIDLLQVNDAELAAKYSNITRVGKTLHAEAFAPALNDHQGAYIFAAAGPLFDDDGNIVGSIETIRDITERKQAEEQLRETNKRLNDIIELLPDATLVIDRQGVVIAWNRAMEEMTGVPKQDMLGKGNYEYAVPFYGERRPVLMDLAMKLDDNINPKKYLHLSRLGDVISGEVYVPMPGKGKGMFLFATASPLRDAAGRIVGAIESIRDITVRQQVEELLRDTNKRLNDIIEFLPDATAVINREGVVIAWNKAMEEMTGILKKDMLGKGNYEYALPFYGSRRPVLLDVAMAPEGFFKEVQYDRLTRNGDIVTSEVFAPMPGKGKGAFIFAMAAPLRDAAGNIVGAVESIRDITARKQTEDALRNEHGQLLSLLNSLDEIVYVSDMDTYEILFVNHVTQTAFNKPLVGGICYKEFQGLDAPCPFCTNPIIRKRPFQPHRWEYTNPQLQRHYAIIDRVIRWPDGRHVRFEMATDITERKWAETEKEKLEAQLHQAIKMEAVGRLAGGVAHDFNNLLTGIAGYTEMLLVGMREDDPMYADLLEIKQAGDRAAALTAQLLAFSRKQIIDPRVVDLNELLSDSTKMLKRLIGEDIELLFHPGPDLGRVMVAPHQMEQVLINLAVNARDAMQDGGKLTIETMNVEIDEEYARSNIDAKSGHYVLLAMSDNGCGMAQEVLTHLFEPFFTTKEKGKGTGLGLSMIYGIVRQNGGFISVYSEVGSGTVIKVYLPLVVGEAETLRKKKVDALPTGSETILLVEDEETVRNFARKILERQGYQVISFEKGGDAIAFAENPKASFDLLLTDVIMPKMNGRQLYETLHNLRPTFRVLYMSGYTEDTIAHHGVLEEGTNFIQKPFSVEGLACKVREVLDTMP